MCRSAATKKRRCRQSRGEHASRNLVELLFLPLGLVNTLLSQVECSKGEPGEDSIVCCCYDSFQILVYRRGNRSVFCAGKSTTAVFYLSISTTRTIASDAFGRGSACGE